MQLNFRRYSDAKSPDDREPLVILHGLFGNLANWGWHSRKLSAHFTVYGVDLRNHGDSPHSDTMHYRQMADDVLEFLDRQGIDECFMLGHSMGGKVAMQLALDQAERVAKLIVVDIAPVHYAENSPSAREGHAAVFAGLHAITPETLKSRSEADQILAGHIPEKDVRGFLLANLTREEKSGYRWRMNVKALHECYEELTRAPEPGSPFTKPVLFIRGGRSDYLREKHHGQLKALFPQARIETVEDAGHWLHAEQPEAVNQLMESFLLSP
ncbi:MAG: alpha/beta fold hydrolase [Pseudohongiellaceae bacterium]